MRSHPEVIRSTLNYNPKPAESIIKYLTVVGDDPMQSLRPSPMAMRLLRKLVGLVADALVVRDRDPPVLSNELKPLFVGGIRDEVGIVALHGQACSPEDFGELLA